MTPDQKDEMVLFVSTAIIVIIFVIALINV